MGCCGGFVGDVFGAVGDAVDSVVGAVGDIGSFADDAVHDVGSFVDDAVNDVVPGGWYTVAAVTGATMGLPTDLGLGEAAAGEGAAFGMSDAMAADLGLSGGSGFGIEGAAGDVLGASGIESASPWGINPSTPTTEFGTFNPGTVSPPGIDASSLGGMEWLGGTGSLAEGTAGLTAEQLANATAAAQVGSNAASGLGYLGGAESLPSGTAGITGVTSGTNWSDFSKSLGDLLGGNQPKNLANALYGGSVDLGGVNIPRSTQPAFSYTQQLPIQSGTSSSPTFLGQLGDMQTQQKLAKLLKG